MKVTIIYSSKNIDAAMELIKYCRRGIGLDPMIDELGKAEFLAEPDQLCGDELFYPLMLDALGSGVTVILGSENSN